MGSSDAGDNVYLSTQIWKNGSHAHSTGNSPYISGTGTVKPLGIKSIVMGTSNEHYTREVQLFILMVHLTMLN